MGGLLSLLKSRKFWITAAAAGAVSWAYAHHNVDAQTWSYAMAALGAVLVGSIAHEDAHDDTKR